MVNSCLLKDEDFVAGRKFKVWKKPEHLTGIHYPYIDVVGECIWYNKESRSANIRFSNNTERLIPADCLTPVETVEENKLNNLNLRIGGTYRITTAPTFWSKCPELFCELGRVGTLIKLTPNSRDPDVVAVLQIGNHQRCVPVSNLTEVKLLPAPTAPVDLADHVLIDKILDNPRGFLKIIKGLAKMNKEPRLKAFLERGLVV